MPKYTGSKSLFLFILLLFQRNHSLFGNVISALTGSVKTGLPFSTRTQSLFINHTQAPPMMSPTNSFHGPHTKPSSANSINGRISPAESTNHIGGDRLNIELNNAKNSTQPNVVTNQLSGSQEEINTRSRRSSKTAR